MDTLTSCRRKIGRAEEHLFPLLAKYEVFKGSRPYAVSEHYEPATRRCSFQILQTDEFDSIELGLLAADWVHNLRSALDHLVWGLVSQGAAISERDAREISFPIEQGYRSFMTQPVIRFLTLDQIAVLEPYQPFAGRDRNKLLLDLHSLWNADKHRVIQPVLVALPQSGIKFWMNEDAGEIVDRGLIQKITLNTDAYRGWVDLGWVEVSAPGPQPDVKVDTLTLEIEMGKRRVQIDSFVPIGMLVFEIVEACAAFFPEADSGL